MNTLGYRPDQKITDVIGRGGFTLSAEVIPPRNGTDEAKALDQIKKLIGCGAEFLSVTKGAGGSLRGGSLPIAHAIKDRFGVPCIAHFTCRDITPEEVENQLMDHHYFGIRNILGLRGDPPQGQAEWVAREGSYNYAYQLIDQIRRLNDGKYLERKGGGPAPENDPVKTDFCIGAACYPEHSDPKERIEFFKLKIDHGAEYGITQMIFDPDAYSDFLDKSARVGVSVPILPGTRVLKTKDQAIRMGERFGISIPKDYLTSLKEKDHPDSMRYALDAFYDFAEKMRAAGAPGMHLYVIADTEGSCAVLRHFGKDRTGSKAQRAESHEAQTGV